MCAFFKKQCLAVHLHFCLVMFVGAGVLFCIVWCLSGQRGVPWDEKWLLCSTPLPNYRGTCVPFACPWGEIPGAPAQGVVVLLQLDTLGITKLKIV